jgi:hypothetical protein
MMATITFCIPAPPCIATIINANSIVGNPITASQHLMIKASVLPPKYPDVIPTAVPTTAPNPRDITLINADILGVVTR